MATIQDAVNKVAELATKLDALIQATTDADNRFNQKIAGLQAQIDQLKAQIATGSDTGPIIDAITPIEQKVDNATAAQQIEGV